jgi:hypothetical protein
MDKSPPATAAGTADSPALDALRFGWGIAYEFGTDDEGPWAWRRDGAGGKIRAGSPDALRAEVIDDYSVKPVSRDLAPPGTPW